MSEFHYFASTAFNWATASTRAEAIAKVAQDLGADQIKRSIKHAECKGVYTWTCRVDAPGDTPYSINMYAPVGVPRSAAMEFSIVNTKGHCIPLEPTA